MMSAIKFPMIVVFLFVRSSLSDQCCKIPPIDPNATGIVLSEPCKGSDVISESSSCVVTCQNISVRFYCVKESLIVLKNNKVEPFDILETCKKPTKPIPKKKCCLPLSFLQNGYYIQPCDEDSDVCKFACKPGFLPDSMYSAQGSSEGFTECTKTGWSFHMCKKVQVPKRILITLPAIKSTQNPPKKENCSLPIDHCDHLPRILGKGLFTGKGCLKNAINGTKCSFVCHELFKAIPQNFLQCNDQHGVILCLNGHWETPICEIKIIKPKPTPTVKQSCGPLPKIDGSFTSKKSSMVYYTCKKGVNYAHLPNRVPYILCKNGLWTLPHCIDYLEVSSSYAPAARCSCQQQKPVTNVANRAGLSIETTRKLPGNEVKIEAKHQKEPPCNSTRDPQCAKSGGALKRKYFMPKKSKATGSEQVKLVKASTPIRKASVSEDSVGLMGSLSFVVLACAAFVM